MIDMRLCSNCKHFLQPLSSQPCVSCLSPHSGRRNWEPAAGAKIAAEEQPAVAEQTEAEEYKGCDNCKFMPLGESENPCVICRNAIPTAAKNYNDFPFMWQPISAEDAVNHPAHYNNGDFECIDVMLAAYGKEAAQNFCLRKARWYLDKFFELEGDTDEQSYTGTTGA